MNIELSVVGMDAFSLAEKVDEGFVSFDLDNLFEHVVAEKDMIARLETRIRTVARLAGVDVDYVHFDDVQFEGHDITPTDDAIERAADVAKFWNWAEGSREWEYLPIIARIYVDNWKYIDFDNLGNEMDNYFIEFSEGDYEGFAKCLVEDCLIDGPGEGWDYYVDWEAKGEDMASDYQQFDYEGTTYLFHN